MSDGTTRPPVAILCGGRGTRLRERTAEIPKPLVEIGGRPILWHVIELYAAQGFERFLLATGYKGELIGEFAAAERWPEGVEVECVDTGLDTPTGGRIKLLEPLLRRGVSADEGEKGLGGRRFAARGRGCATPTSARPTPTALPTSTSPGSCISTRITARSPR